VRLSGISALVTGAASGSGGERRFYRHDATAEAGALGCRFAIVDPGEWPSVAPMAAQIGGLVDILVNNVGVTRPATIPLGRFPSPEGNADAAVPCSAEAPMVTGVALEVDGERCI
jgi:NAD(P)-dependent dehydrogenase (short-subunit alcohol dehydrogenase family)